jgi:phenylpyruvate tautomerase PptA (4-oxalocrotonate tautomerase family)
MTDDQILREYKAYLVRKLSEALGRNVDESEISISVQLRTADVADGDYRPGGMGTEDINQMQFEDDDEHIL